MRIFHRDDPEACGIYVGRPTKWGNPFKIGVHGTRSVCIEKYEAWVRSQPLLVAAIKRELKGHPLICSCFPDRCHAEILMKIANEP